MVTKRDIILFMLGAVFADLLLGIRMYNPILLREAIFYITEYKGLYFIFHSMISLSFGLIAIAILILIERKYKKKKSETVHIANSEEDKWRF